MHLITPSLLQSALVWKTASETAGNIRNYLQKFHRHQSLNKTNGNCLITNQQSYRHESFSSSEITTSADNEHNPIQSQFTNEDDFYGKLLDSDNRQRFLNCIQNKRRKSQDEQITKSPPKSKLASVLIAICTDRDRKNPSLLYTRRSRQLRSHMLQISFPGGNNEKDEDPVDCALRETSEEIGLHRDRVVIWGKGRILRTSPSATSPVAGIIIPVIGVVENFDIEELILNESEVEEAFSVPIKHLNNTNNCSYTQFRNGYTSPVFRLDNQVKIWGITGFLTRMFLNCLLPSDQNQIHSRYKYINPYPTNLDHLPPPRSSPSSTMPTNLTTNSL